MGINLLLISYRQTRPVSWEAVKRKRLCTSLGNILLKCAIDRKKPYSNRCFKAENYSKLLKFDEIKGGKFLAVYNFSESTCGIRKVKSIGESQKPSGPTDPRIIKEEEGSFFSARWPFSQLTILLQNIDSVPIAISKMRFFDGAFFGRGRGECWVIYYTQIFDRLVAIISVLIELQFVFSMLRLCNFSINLNPKQSSNKSASLRL